MLKNDLFVSWIKRENIAKQALWLILATKASKNTNIKIDICIFMLVWRNVKLL
jgi:hypothetical protein